MREAVARAFDAEALAYDPGFGQNPVGLFFRYVFQQRLSALFPEGARVLDLGCGTGEDALFLAARGRRVHALDVAPGMAELTRTKARAQGLGADTLVVEARAAEDLVGLAGEFDGAYSDFGALNCVALPRLGAALASVLRPGAPLLLSLMGASPLPHTLRRLLTGRGERRGQTNPRVAGTPVPVRYPAIREVQAELGHDFLWRDVFALGVLLPDPAHAAWAAEHPQSFGVLATLEARIRRWPLLRGLGDHFVLEGLRRAA